MRQHKGKLIKRYILRSDGVRQRYTTRISTIKSKGLQYNKSKRAYSKIIPLTRKPTLKESIFVQKKLRIENKIRDAVFHSIPHVNRKLANLLPIAYDPDAKTWIVNDYKGKHPIPLEIKISIARSGSSDIYSVDSYEFRGDKNQDIAQELQAHLNGK